MAPHPAGSILIHAQNVQGESKSRGLLLLRVSDRRTSYNVYYVKSWIKEVIQNSRNWFEKFSNLNHAAYFFGFDIARQNNLTSS